jgi:hypothetical protein
MNADGGTQEAKSQSKLEPEVAAATGTEVCRDGSKANGSLRRKLVHRSGCVVNSAC